MLDLEEEFGMYGDQYSQSTVIKSEPNLSMDIFTESSLTGY